MTDLTEQWKKGELPLGWYYVKYKNDKIELAENIKWFDCGGWCDNRFLHSKNISGVIAPAPSYDELQNMNKAVNECMAANIKLVEENAQLKELLKEVFVAINEGSYFDQCDILKKIDEALK